MQIENGGFLNKSKHKGAKLHWIVAEFQSRIGWGRDARPCVSTRYMRRTTIKIIFQQFLPPPFLHKKGKNRQKCRTICKIVRFENSKFVK